MPEFYHLGYDQMGIEAFNWSSNIYTYSLFAEKTLRTTANAVNCIDSEAARYLRMVAEMISTRCDEIATMSFYGPVKDGKKFEVSRKQVPEFMRLSIATKDDEAVFLDTVYEYDDDARNEAKKRLEENLKKILDKDFNNIDGRIFYNLAQIYEIEYTLWQNGYTKCLNVVSKEQEDLIATYPRRSQVISILISRAIKLLYERISGVNNNYFCTHCGYYFKYKKDYTNCPSCGEVMSMCIQWPKL